MRCRPFAARSLVLEPPADGPTARWFVALVSRWRGNGGGVRRARDPSVEPKGVPATGDSDSTIEDAVAPVSGRAVNSVAVGVTVHLDLSNLTLLTSKCHGGTLWHCSDEMSIDSGSFARVACWTRR